MSSSNEEFAVSDKDTSNSLLTSQKSQDGGDKLKPLDEVDKVSESQTKINKDLTQPQTSDGSSGSLPGPQQATPAQDLPDGVDNQEKARPAVLSDAEKCKLIQQQLKLYFHAQNCQPRLGEKECNLLNCKIIKIILYHMWSCQAGKNCRVSSHCTSARKIIGHWNDCVTKDCPLCLPRKETEKNERTDTDDAATQPDSQTSPSFADIKRAYDAIVMSGTDDEAATTATLQHQDIRNFRLPGCLQPGQVIAVPLRATNEWHRTVAPGVRSRFVFKTIIVLFPDPTPERLTNPKIHTLIRFARKLEADAYKDATSITQYYHLLTEKILEAQKEIAELRKVRAEQQLQV